MRMPRADPRWWDEFHPWSGIEHGWLGVDLQGHVAVFTTAGYGLVPMEVDRHLADVDAALDQVGQLPLIASADDILRSAHGHYSHWHAYSAKGFYAYDWQQWTGRYYQRLSSPPFPISVGHLPEEIQAVAHFAEFPLKFADEAMVVIEYAEPPAR
ncbi:MAG TPA: hypothetical protein VEV45_17355 [Streptosporangiaceae bacterium]|nr:hypothetical protein [Streptosporangiaceae bacterium]